MIDIQTPPIADNAAKDHCMFDSVDTHIEKCLGAYLHISTIIYATTILFIYIYIYFFGANVLSIYLQ